MVELRDLYTLHYYHGLQMNWEAMHAATDEDLIRIAHQLSALIEFQKVTRELRELLPDAVRTEIADPYLTLWINNQFIPLRDAISTFVGNRRMKKAQEQYLARAAERISK